MAIYHYTGGTDKSPFVDIEAYKARAKQKMPELTDRGVSQMAQRSLDLIRPRAKRYVVTFWGRDILTEDLEGLWFWPYLKRSQQGRLAAHPLVGGQMYEGDDLDRKKALLANPAFHTVNREVLVCSRGEAQMQQTAVFCVQTDWQQEISDSDAAILLSYRQVRHLLVREDRYTGYNPVQSFSHIPVLDRHQSPTMTDMNYLLRQLRRSNAHSGVDVPTERT